jgi:ATP-dependent Clp protease ATP-binding subunit ClpX
MKSLKELQELINQTVIGQQDGVKDLSTAFYKHLLKLATKNHGYFFNHSTTLLLTGSTGTGKTHLCRTLAENVDIPFIEINAKSINQEGWHGKSFVQLLEEQMPNNRSTAIVFIDEFDKMLMKLSSDKTDNYNYHLQTGLLKYIEGFNIRLNPNLQILPFGGRDINTKNFMFILAGAFVGLILEPEKQIGFNSDTSIRPTLLNAMIEFGMIPELAGRIQHVCTLKDLTKTDYLMILESDDFILNKYIQMLTKLQVCAKLDKESLIDEAV